MPTRGKISGGISANRLMKLNGVWNKTVGTWNIRGNLCYAVMKKAGVLEYWRNGALV